MLTLDDRTQSGTSLEVLARRHALEFARRWGAGVQARVFFAPGRVNLMGAHLDYNGGPVMPTAIDRGTIIAVRLRNDRRLTCASLLDSHTLEVDLDALPQRSMSRWTDYPLGVVREMLRHSELRGGTARLPGMDLLFGGNLPVGAGLSSSASICVGTAFVLDCVWELGCERLELVQAALHAERGFVGVQCGIMDPFAVGLARAGELLWLDCRDTTWSWMPLDHERYSIAVADTLVRRAVAQSEFNARVDQCRAAYERLRVHQSEARCLRDIRLDVFEAHAHELGAPIARRAEHVIHEVARTFEAREALRRGDPAAFGAAMSAAHVSLRELFEVSVPELDLLVEAAVETPGVLGSRLTGAGFGGCTVVLLERGAEQALRERLIRKFESRFGYAPRVEVYGGDCGPRELLVGRSP